MTTPLPGNAAIETRALLKAFRGTRAVDGVDLTVPVGGVYGLLGPNGAGKTTTIRMLATLLAPDGGEARIFGHDVFREAPAVRARIALTGQFASIDGDLTGEENLMLQARLRGFGRRTARRRVAELLDVRRASRPPGNAPADPGVFCGVSRSRSAARRGHRSRWTRPWTHRAESSSPIHASSG